MLTTDEAIVVFEGGRAVPDRLTVRRHRAYLRHADLMLAAYRSGLGKTRRELHREVEAVLEDEPDCDPRRVRAFAKLLDDRSEFAADPDGLASDLRLRVFGAAAKHHPLVERADGLFETSEAEAKSLVAGEVGRPWPEVERELYADVPDLQRLLAFDGYEDARALLSRYNVAQLQACLYRAESVSVLAREGLKTILRYAKLARLLHTIERVGEDTYRIDLSGPASVLRETRRYGVDLARFVPALLACRDFAMEAAIVTPWGWKARLELTSEDGLRSHLPPEREFDSSIEEGFARKFGEERAGWRLLREARILCEGQATFVPDFVFRHTSGVEVLFEIVGFWTPEYLAKKRETLARFAGHRILVALPERSLRSGTAGFENAIAYKTAIKLEPVLAALEGAVG